LRIKRKRRRRRRMRRRRKRRRIPRIDLICSRILTSDRYQSQAMTVANKKTQPEIC